MVERPKNPFRNPEIIDGGVDAEVIRRAYEENMAKGIIIDRSAAANIGVDSLKEAIHTAAEQAGFEPSTRTESELNQWLIGESPAKHEFLRTFHEHEKLFQRIGSEIPTPQEFFDAGVDFLGLAAAWEIMKYQQNLEPQLVIAPAYGTEQPWKNLYRQLAEKGLIGPFTDGGDPYDVLKIRDECSAHWDILDIASVNPPGTKGNGTVRKRDVNGENVMTRWTIRLIPGTVEPSLLDSHYDSSNSNHPSIGEYLTLQAVRCQMGMPPVDYEPSLSDRLSARQYKTWLRRTFTDIWLQAPVATYAGDTGFLYISSVNIDDSFSNLGRRVAVGKLQ